jgi:hypothetical protein
MKIEYETTTRRAGEVKAFLQCFHVSDTPNLNPGKFNT